jgi:hypothetical protein
MIEQRRFATWPFFVLFVCLVALIALLPKFLEHRPGQEGAMAENSSPRVEQKAEEPATQPKVSPVAETATLAEPEVAEIVEPQEKYTSEVEAAPATNSEPSKSVATAEVSLSGVRDPAEHEDLHETPSTDEETAADAALPKIENAEEKAPEEAEEPIRVANIPSNDRQLPELGKSGLKELMQSKEPAEIHPLPPAVQELPPNQLPKNWYQPTALLTLLDELKDNSATSAWASETKELIEELGPALANDSQEAARIAERLSASSKKVPALADQLSAAAQKAYLRTQKLDDWYTVRKLRKAGYALERRMEIWRGAAKLGAEKIENQERVAGNPKQLSVCLATLDTALPYTTEGRRWRDYLMLDAMNDMASQRSRQEEEVRRQMARTILERIDQTPMTSRQRNLIMQPQLIALREQLRHWAAEPSSPADILRSVERYEQSGLSSDARQLAKQLQAFAVSEDATRRELAKRIDEYYRNANLRVSLSEKMLNRLIPARSTELAPVNDTVLGVPVRGQSLTSSDLAIRLIPDPTRVRLALEVTGQVAATTSSSSGPATFYNDSQSVYAAQKGVEINSRGIRLLPAEVDVRHETRLRDVSTDFDDIPLFGFFARRVAQTQHDLFSGSANGEAKRKVAAKARERIDNEALDQFSKMVERLNQNLFGPLVNLALEPTIVEAQTTADRLTMRLRIAGEDQLGGYTPRPQAPSECLASFQIHESMLNNAMQRLQLEGQTLTLKELIERISERFQRPNVWQINPEHEDVKVTFAAKDAVSLHCRDGQVMLSLSIAELSKEPRSWTNFRVNVFFKPEINGRTAELTREGSIHLLHEPMSMGTQIALRGVFAKAFPAHSRINLMPERFMSDAKLQELSVIQFSIDDGWIGVALGDKPRELRTARQPSRSSVDK